MVRRLGRDQRGQATTEYILLLAILVGFGVTAMRTMNRIRIGEKLMQPITREFRMAYKYGNPEASGPDEGQTKNHPRFTSGENSFRLFRRLQK